MANEPSAYEKRLWVEVDRILYQNYLTPRTVTDFWRGDRDAIVWHLKQMKERVMRTIVIGKYVEVDDLLNRTIAKHFFPSRSSKQSKRRATLYVMLDKLYPQQKLDIIKQFRVVPREVSSNVMALNELRNSFAHKFHLGQIHKSKRLYKGKYDVFTKKGLDKFNADMWEVDGFFDPDTQRIAQRLVDHQKRANADEGRRVAHPALPHC